MAKAVRQSDASAYAHTLHWESTRTLAFRGVGGMEGWGWEVVGGGVTQVHNKYDAELERVQDGEQKCRLKGGGKKKTRRGSVKEALNSMREKRAAAIISRLLL